MTPDLLPVRWVGFPDPAGWWSFSRGSKAPFPLHPPRTVCPFVGRHKATTSIRGTSRDCCHPFCVLKPFERLNLRESIKLFKLPPAKNYFPATLLIRLRWNKVPLFSGSCGRCVAQHTLHLPTWVLPMPVLLPMVLLQGPCHHALQTHVPILNGFLNFPSVQPTC